MKLSLPKILCFCIALFSIIASSFRHDGNASSFTTYNPISHFSPSSDDLANLYTYSNQESFIQNDVQSVHASTLLRIPNALMVLYFGGTREGAADVKIYRSMLYDNARVWSKPEVILTREMLSKYSGKFIKKLGNPVAFSDIHGRIHVFVVGVSLGGWATSKIYQFYYNNNALHYVGELHLSEFANFSTLVRNPPILLDDGGFIMPIYHEFASKYALLAFFDSNAKLREVKRINYLKSQLQPSIIALDKSHCLAFFRYYRADDNNAYIQTCSDYANKWQPPVQSNIKNHDSSSVLVNLNINLESLDSLHSARDSMSHFEALDKQSNQNLDSKNLNFGDSLLKNDNDALPYPYGMEFMEEALCQDCRDSSLPLGMTGNLDSKNMQRNSSVSLTNGNATMNHMFANNTSCVMLRTKSETSSGSETSFKSKQNLDSKENQNLDSKNKDSSLSLGMTNLSHVEDEAANISLLDSMDSYDKSQNDNMVMNKTSENNLSTVMLNTAPEKSLRQNQTSPQKQKSTQPYIILIHNDGVEYNEGEKNPHARHLISLYWLRDIKHARFEKLLTLDTSRLSHGYGEISYPSAIVDDTYLHITYTYNRGYIKYIRIKLETLKSLIKEKEHV